jgi:virginiamycin B lyase
VPNLLGSPQGLYENAVGGDGSVWFACSGVNALIRYDPTRGVFTFYTLPQAQSVPYGLALDAAGHAWFTADGTPNFIAELQA